MSLDLALLENVHQRGSRTIARCPACAERGHDEKGEHLVIMANGAFGCVVCPGDAGKSHRQRIHALAGDAISRQRGACMVRVRRPAHATMARQSATVLDLVCLGGVQTIQKPAVSDGDSDDHTLPEIADGVANVGRTGRVLFPYASREEKNIDSDRKEKIHICMVGKEASNPSGPIACRNYPQAQPPIFCTLRSDLDRVAADLAGAPRIALDIETYGECKGDGLDPWKGNIRLLTLCRHGGPIWTIDLRATGYELDPLIPILERSVIIAHNAKFDLLWLWVKCGLIATKVHCTLTAARLLAAGTKPGNNLDQCLER